MSANRNLVLLVGKSAAGKTASLRDIQNPQGVLYCNCEAGKELPFAAPFKKLIVTNPLQIFEVFEQAEKADDCHTIVIDSLTYLMDMYESVYVIKATNTMQAWGEYAQYFKKLMQHYVAKSTKNVVFIAHTVDQLNEATMEIETFVKVKGSTMNTGVESYFNTVIACKKIPLTTLEDQKSDYLHITEEETALGFKYVYQTRLTKKTVNERIRGPMGMWSPQETFIDNDLQMITQKFNEYYNGGTI